MEAPKRLPFSKDTCDGVIADPLTQDSAVILYNQPATEDIFESTTLFVTASAASVPLMGTTVKQSYISHLSGINKGFADVSEKIAALTAKGIETDEQLLARTMFDFVGAIPGEIYVAALKCKALMSKSERRTMKNEKKKLRSTSKTYKMVTKKNGPT